MIDIKIDQKNLEKVTYERVNLRQQVERYFKELKAKNIST
jgi:hypothetical protein